MSSPQDHSSSDRNLLFGILALQMNFITRDHLVEGMHAWVLDKMKPLGQVLLQQCRLSAAQVQALDVLLVEHLKAHGDDAERSMQALPAASTVPSTLGSIRDDDVQSSVSKLGTASVGEPTKSYRAPTPSNGARFQKRSYHKGGGLGDVYFAEDTELHREVALKEIKPKHADDPVARARFVVEAEITGGLEHPGIVPVYGLGTYPDGRPHYAMRFIRGDDLKKAIEHFHTAEKPDRDAGERSLEFRQLLRRFIDVCNAVGYAHSRGVVHRDLKPANVMLGKFGETLVIDWGLAKTGLEPKRRTQDVAPEPILKPQSGSNVYHTQAGTAPGTVPYMSPEQARGDELTPASDIYSLGSTLYKLLTNQAPYAASDPHELLAKVQHGLFASPREARPDTPAGLDAICRKAMSLKPENRYATALDLAADIEHWLADEPVSAYAEPLAVRVGRWARRHRSAVVGTVVFLVVAVVALSVSTGLIWAEQRETAKQKEIAVKHFVLARDLSINSIDLFESAEIDLASKPAMFARRKEILVTATRSYQQMLTDESHNLQVCGQAAKVFRYTANVHRLENETEPAVALYQQSIDLGERVITEQPQDVESQLHLSNTLRDQANQQVKLGKLDEGKKNLEKSIAIATEIHKADKGNASALRAVAASQLDLSAVASLLGEPGQAKDLATKATAAFDTLRKLVGKARPYDPLLYAAALNRIAVAERESSKPDDARKKHSQAAKILEGMKAKPPANVVAQDIDHMLAWCRLDQAKTFAKYSNLRTAADTNMGGAALVWGDLAKRSPKVSHYPALQATALLARGQLRLEDKRREDAKKDFEAAAVLLKPMVEKSPEIPGYSADLGRAYLGLARYAGLEGKQAEATRWYKAAAKALAKAAEQSPRNVLIDQSLKEVRREQQKN